MRCSRAVGAPECSEEEGREMDTPERSKVPGAGGTPLSKFEDSPVFNFINNLSPIQPVRSVDSVHIAHTYQTLNFASLTSIFSSPHANPQRESKTLVRDPFTVLSKEDTFCDNVDEKNPNTRTSTSVGLSICAVVAQDSCTKATLADTATANPADECSAIPSSITPLSQYDAGSPNHNTSPSNAVKVDAKYNVDPTSVELVQYVECGIENRKKLFPMETMMQENHSHKKSRDEELTCDWENLICDDDGGLLIFDSLIGPDAHVDTMEETMQKNIGSHCSLVSKSMENADKLQDLKSDNLNGCGVPNASDDPLSNCSEDIVKKDGTDHASTIVSDNSDNQADNQQQRGMRRRCLIFEGAGLSKKNTCQDSNHDLSSALPSKGKNPCSNNLKPEITVPCVLPGIGLHLNTLSTSSKDRITSKETVVTGKNVISMQSCFGPLFPLTSGQRSLNEPISVKKDVHDNDREVEDPQAIHDETPQNIALELSQGSPKKKRRKLENGSEGDGCKRCNCKKSKCLKLYCECFAAGVYCSEPCSCQGCFNKPIHEETVLATRKQIESRNPLAFAPKVIRTSETGQEMREDDNKTPASARHKRGCNCKKSSCLKKYCECYQGGVGCSLSCRCEGCKNAFGRKDGILPISEIELADDGADALDREKESPEGGQQNASVQLDEQPSDSILPITPSVNCRLSIDLQLFSSAKPPRSSKFSVGPSPGLYGSHMLQKSDILLSQHTFENNLNTIHEDDMPAILRATASPTNHVKTVSPNSKRISPPHNAIGPSPARKGGRKLILKSIPSFPSLSSDVSTDCPMSFPDSSLSSSAFS